VQMFGMVLATFGVGLATARKPAARSGPPAE
jgi:hypothetical protein